MTYSSEPRNFLTVRTTTFFVASTPETGTELWKTDGTADGTWQLDDIVAGPVSSTPSGFTLSGSLLYFTAGEALDGRELWAIPVSAIDPTPCVGDCDGKGSVTVDELLMLVNIALGNAEAAACPSGVASGVEVDVAVIIQAVNNALSGCGA